MKSWWPVTVLASCFHYKMEAEFYLFIYFFERMKVSIRMNKPLTYSSTLPPLYLLTARLHLQSFVMFRYNRNELCIQLWWPTYCKDSHAMNSFSPAYTCVISIACLICQQAHESPILGMSVHSVWAECLGMLKGPISFHLKISRTCMHFDDGCAYNECQRKLKRWEWEGVGKRKK